MFKSAEIGHALSKATYAREEPKLRQALLDAQYTLLERARAPVVVLVNGVDGAGKGETVNLFNEWMDPRHIRTHGFGPATSAERAMPAMWRFWQALPPKGKIAVFFGSWYTDPILGRVMGGDKRSSFERRLTGIRQFERMLVAEGAVILKLWFHLSKRAQKRRFKALLADERTAWRVGPGDWERFKQYDEFVEVCERALRDTSTGEAPWHVIEGADPAYRSITAGRLLLDAMRSRLDGAPPPIAPPAPPPAPPADGRNLLAVLEQPETRLKRKSYDERLALAQARLNALSRDERMRRSSLVLVFEGMDAAGKGSTIRRVTRALDARYYRVVPIAAPTEEERAQPYLWRFWRHVPRPGHTAIFDRSWYGRVLVERVEALCSVSDSSRAYREINEFEEQLTEAGAIVAKFWLAVSQEEQLRRFEEREKTPYKRFKITQEDWRNRKQWPAYEQAVCDMIDRTSTASCPWTVVAADDKLRARLTVMARIIELVETRWG